MTENKTLLKTILNYLPKSVWNFELWHGSFITLDLGKKIKRKEPDGCIGETGEIHLWIYLCDWALTQNNNLIVSSESDRETIPAVFKKLCSLQLLNIQNNTTDTLNIIFDNNYILSLKANTDLYEKKDDMLITFIDGKTPIAYSPEKGFYIEE